MKTAFCTLYKLRNTYTATATYKNWVFDTYIHFN